jgi:sterol desaturase/sphingolipid hydroxylase (fatty acid hydroxylase superfamily)
MAPVVLMAVVAWAGSTWLGIELPLGNTKAVVALGVLAVLWLWETWLPFFEVRPERLRHAGRNLAVAVFNTVILAAAFSYGIMFVAAWAQQNDLGLLHAFDLGGPVRLALALILLDGWMYLWHRANHMIPFLWRFHRMHHSDTQMDVTTATRFHLGEHIGASVLRAGLIPLLGFEVWHFIIYDTLVIAVTMLHHANVSLGRADRWLRWLIVTPDMHKIHHSNWRPETDSNYSTVLSVWDRIARTFRMRNDPKTLQFGLPDFTDSGWQTVWGMLRTPLVTPPSGPEKPLPEAALNSHRGESRRALQEAAEK